MDGHTLMYYSDPGGGYPPRQIEHADQNGGLYMVALGPIHLYPICTSPQNWPLNCPSLQIENGISEVLDYPLSVSVYPNPFSESITIHADIDEAADMKVSIFDLLGQMVAVQDYGVQSGTIEESINVAPLSMGMYLIQVSIGESHMIVKLIKR